MFRLCSRVACAAGSVVAGAAQNVVMPLLITIDSISIRSTSNHATFCWRNHYDIHAKLKSRFGIYGEQDAHAVYTSQVDMRTREIAHCDLWLPKAQ